MGNRIMGDNVSDRASYESKKLVKTLRHSLTMNKLINVLIEY